jgi:DNA-directed RNA polymerase subunit RPC12/RpoP
MSSRNYSVAIRIACVCKRGFYVKRVDRPAVCPHCGHRFAVKIKCVEIGPAEEPVSDKRKAGRIPVGGGVLHGAKT